MGPDNSYQYKPSCDNLELTIVDRKWSRADLCSADPINY